jgi:hypothetical protein
MMMPSQRKILKPMFSVLVTMRYSLRHDIKYNRERRAILSDQVVPIPDYSAVQAEGGAQKLNIAFLALILC